MPRYAAIDIGSNSIRMQAAEVAPGSATRILAAEREVTRLGEGVFRNGSMNEEAMRLTCDVLSRMGAQFRALEVAGIRAVATSSVRDARNQTEFLERAAASVGAPVEVISGREEARLIHLGVLSRWPQPGKRVLVIDIGGGSVEIIGVEDGRMVEAVSKPLGAVRLREIFLTHDPPDARIRRGEAGRRLPPFQWALGPCDRHLGDGRGGGLCHRQGAASETGPDGPAARRHRPGSQAVCETQHAGPAAEA